MFVLAHLGIGQNLAAPFSRRLPRRPLLLGMLLPDLIDKPLYYALRFWNGNRPGTYLGIIAGTRTFGHTAIFLLALTAAAILRRSRVLAALSLGVATHLLLDNIGNPFRLRAGPIAGRALLWPLHGWVFPLLNYSGLTDHVSQLVIDPFIFWTELLGLALLLWHYWKARNEREIVQSTIQSFRERRRRGRRWRRKTPGPPAS